MNKQYKNPPIVEAVFEVRFVSPIELDDEKIEKFSTLILSIFPEKKISYKREINIKEEEKQQTIERQISKIYNFVSIDSALQVQLEENRFSVHVTTPYIGWRKFTDIVQKVIDSHFRNIKWNEVARLGLRYINHIEKKNGNTQCKIFSSPYTFPESLNSKIADHYSNSLFKTDEHNNLLRIQVKDVIEALESQDVNNLILDIDYYCARDKKYTVNEVFKWLESGHGEIEEVFESYLTKDIKDNFDI